MPFIRHKSSNRIPAGKTRLKKSSSRGNSLSPDPGKRLITSAINCMEIGKACDAFLESRVPGYRLMSFSGRPAKSA